MKKLISALIPRICNPLGDNEPDMTAFMRNLILIALTLMSISFTAGDKLSAARNIPGKINAMQARAEDTDRKILELQKKQEISDVQRENMVEILKSIQLDVREIRSSQKEGRR